MRFALAALLLAVLSGCSVTLRPDPSMPAADAGYPTAEFTAMGRTFHGLGEVLLRRGDQLNNVSLSVQGYYDGVIRVDSQGCGVAQSWTYSKNEKKPIEIPGVADKSCLIDITVSPSFGELADELLIYEMKGQLLIKVLDDGQEWEGYSSKIPVGGNARLRFPVAMRTPAPPRLFFRGCESSYNWAGQAVNGQISVDAADLSGPITKRRCFYEGALQQDGHTRRLSWLVWGYESQFSPLPVPSITDCLAGSVCILADDSVSIIALDDDFRFTNTTRFKLSEKVPHTLRLFTVKGRTAVCHYDPATKGWTCLN